MDKNDKFFYLEKIFPKPIEILVSNYKTINEIKDSCLFIFDTNILLLPYKTSPKSLEELKRIYLTLLSQNRLYIPARVLREFGNNRGKNLAEIYKRLKQKENSLDKFDLKIDFFPLLENEQDYKDVENVEKEIKNLIRKNRVSLKNLQNRVSNYNWNDPVSLMYKDLFKEEIIIDVKKERELIIEDLNFRIEHKIAPGYNDSSKSDKGIGDLIIWQTILEIGKEHDKDIIFVTDDSKNDWFYIEEKQTIYPKFELFDEFRRYSQNTIHILDITNFLEIQDASKETIRDIENTKESETYDESANWNIIPYTELEVGMFVNYTPTIEFKKRKSDNGVILEIISSDDFFGKIIKLKTNRGTVRVSGKGFTWWIKK